MKILRIACIIFILGFSIQIEKMTFVLNQSETHAQWPIDFDLDILIPLLGPDDPQAKCETIFKELKTQLLYIEPCSDGTHAAMYESVYYYECGGESTSGSCRPGIIREQSGGCDFEHNKSDERPYSRCASTW